MWNRFKTFDPWLYVLPIGLMITSVVVIYTLTVDSQGPGLALRQGVNVGIGLIALVAITFIDYRSFRAWAPWLFIIGLLSLLIVRFIGQTQFGAQSWINFGFFQFQPSELMKLVDVVVLSTILSARRTISTWRFLWAVAALLVPVVFVLLEPDFGTALVILIAGTVLMLYAPIRRWQRLVVVGGILAMVLAVALSFKGVQPFDHLLKTYQKDRLASFIDPSRDPTKSGYNVMQSVIAVGSGGLTGKGFSFSTQSQLNFLPVAQADFIFATIAEAWGLVGAVCILATFFFFITRILHAGYLAQDTFGSLICIGVATIILVQVMVNIGMNIRVMPVTGIPLPFLSYGGSAMFINCLAIGIIQSIVIRYKRLTF
jgi:rod shape determining protein RodA